MEMLKETKNSSDRKLKSAKIQWEDVLLSVSDTVQYINKFIIYFVQKLLFN